MENPEPVQLTVEDVLSAIGQFGRASAELVGWEYFSDAAGAEPALAVALTRGLLQTAAPDTETGEPSYQLTPRGRAWLRHRMGEASATDTGGEPARPPAGRHRPNASVRSWRA